MAATPRAKESILVATSPTSISTQTTCSHHSQHTAQTSLVGDDDSITDIPQDLEALADETTGLLDKDRNATIQECSLYVNAIITEIGMGRYQKALFWLCGMGWLCDNLWLQTLAVCVPFIQKEFQLSDTLSAIGTTSAMIGMMLGALFWGRVADKYGRKPVFNLTLLMCAVFGGLAAFAPTISVLCLCFALMGFGIGGNLPIDGSLLLEFMPKQHQNQLVLMSLFWPVGQVIASLFGYLLIPNCVTSNECNSLGWRYVMMASGASTMIMFIARYVCFNMLESPKFLLSVGKRKEAYSVLHRLSVVNRKSLSLELHNLPVLKDDNKTSRNSFQQLKVLLNRPYRLTTVLVWMIWCLVSMAYTMVYAFLPLLLKGRETVLSEQVDFMIISLCGIPGSILAMFAVESRAGRKGTMVLSTLLTGFCLVCFASVSSPWSSLLSNCMANMTSNVMYGVIYSYTPEVFPTHVRGTATGMAAALARITGSISPTLTGGLLGISPNLPLFISAGLFTLQAVCMMLLPLETRDVQAL